ncbi:general secretion pathway protein GspK (plasmid) [Amphritea atlantica]|uniref:General secretion pathway protein GspK n=1 Tax=Amphritea atlantica TaxID=355243 RepID=A0ABY5H1R5_9GAMM|nr:general secretion pathway protein GspK [Amphritea atlantica]
MNLNVSDKPASSPELGVALISVLWLTVLLSLIAVTVSFTGRTNARLTLNFENATHAQYAFEAGVQWAFWGLLLPEAERPWLADGTVHSMNLDDAIIHVAVTDENGKVDLNSASGEMLKALFVAAGLDDLEAESLSDAIMDWRDTDDLKRLNGAEDNDYQQAGFSYGAKDAPFDSIMELKRVLGMDDQLFNTLAGSITVYSNTPSVNPLVAPKLVLMAFTGWEEYQALEFINDRRAAHAEGVTIATNALTSPFFSTSSRGLNYTVLTQAVLKTNTRSGKSVVIQRRGGKGKEIFNILDTYSLNKEVFKDNMLIESEGLPL